MYAERDQEEAKGDEAGNSTSQEEVKMDF